MKVELYNQYVRSQMNRRSVLKGAASVGALAAMGGAAPALAGSHSGCLLYTSPSPRDVEESRMPSSA